MNTSRSITVKGLVLSILLSLLLAACQPPEGAATSVAATAEPVTAVPGPGLTDLTSQPVLAIATSRNSNRAFTAYIGQPGDDPLLLPTGDYYLEALDGNGQVYSGWTVQIDATAPAGGSVPFNALTPASGDQGAMAVELQILAQFLLSIKVAEFTYLETISQGFQAPLAADLTAVDLTPFHDGLEAIATQGPEVESAWRAFSARADLLLTQAGLPTNSGKRSLLARRTLSRPQLGVWDKLASFVGLSGELDERYRQEIAEVSAQMTPVQKEDAFFWLTDYERKGAQNYDEFLQLLDSGELDDRNIKIIYNRLSNSEHYQGIYQTLHPDSNRPGGEAIHHAGSELIKRGAELEVEVIKAVLTGAFPEMTSGFEYADKASEWADFIKNMYEQPLTALQGLVGDKLKDKLQENIALDLQAVIADLDDETAAALAEQLTNEAVALSADLATRIAQSGAEEAVNGEETVASESASPDHTPTPEIESTPEVETTPVVEGPLVFEDAITGITIAAPEYFNLYTKGWTRGEATTYAKHMMLGLTVRARSRETAALPGDTALAAVTAVYENEYVAADEDLEWTVVEEPYEFELNGEPAARMLVARYDPLEERTHLLQLTTIRGETRSAVVGGWVLAEDEERFGALPMLAEIADSVRLDEPAPICYVGAEPGTDPLALSVRCDGATLTGKEDLELVGRGQIELGPVTWEACAAYMREHGYEKW